MKQLFLPLLFAVGTVPAIETDTLETLTVTEQITAETSYSRDQGFRYIPLTERRGERNLSELLSSVPGVSVMPTGAAGAYETVSIRGVDGSRVTVCVDGIPATSAMGGPVDLSRFSLDNSEGIEIYRGIAPASLGGNSLGGVINLITKSGSGGSRELSARFGSFSEVATYARIGQELGEVNVRGFVEYRRAENDFPYFDINGTTYNTSDDSLKNLPNNCLKELHTTAAVSKKVSFGELNLSWEYRDKSLGIPAVNSSPNKTATTDETEQRLLFTLKQKHNLWSIDHALSGNWNSNRVFWTGLDNFGIVHGTLKRGQWGELKSTTAIADYRTGIRGTFAEQFTIAGTASGRFEQMIPITDVPSFGYGEWKSSRLTGTGAADLIWSPGIWNISTGGSISLHRSHTEGGEDPYSGNVLQNQTTIEYDPAGKLGLSLSPREPVSLFINGALYSRTPSLRELFGYHGAVQPSPDLNRESGQTAEAGLGLATEKLSGELVFFVNHYENLVATLSDRTSAKAFNIGENRSYGLEHSFRWSPLSKLTLRESVTFQKTENLSNLYGYKGHFLPNQPPLTLYGDFSAGPFAGFILTPQIKWQSLLFRDLANTQRYPEEEGALGKLDLSISAEWKCKWLKATGSVRNILDSRIHDESRYTIENGYVNLLYPGLGWNFEITVDL